MKRLFVTGGRGYLGREVVGLAAALGWDVRATWWLNAPQGLKAAQHEADWVRLDIRDADAVRSAVEGCDAVIHTAYRQVEDAWSINAEGSAVVAAAARHARLVHLSSDIVFDGTSGGYREDDPVSPVHAYGRSKAEAERLVAELHPEATIVRTSLIYGGAEAGPQERLAREGRRFFVDEIRSPVQVEDLARALLELTELDYAGPLHAGGADDISRYDFAVLLGADPRRIESANTTPDRAPNVSLDSSRAADLLKTRLRGVQEVLKARSS